MNFQTSTQNTRLVRYKRHRNILAHDYFDIDPDEVYEICSTDYYGLETNA